MKKSIQWQRSAVQHRWSPAHWQTTTIRNTQSSIPFISIYTISICIYCIPLAHDSMNETENEKRNKTKWNRKMVFKLARKVIMNVSKVRKWDTECQIIYVYSIYMNRERERDTLEYCSSVDILPFLSPIYTKQSVGSYSKRPAKGDGGKFENRCDTEKKRNVKRIIYANALVSLQWLFLSLSLSHFAPGSLLSL